ncbi:MAG TPA: hypothetical protein VNR18_11735 [Hyphomicrobiales bacterium]|nr:hypothetical protein [Hyphomicrobiales bacterium]
MKLLPLRKQALPILLLSLLALQPPGAAAQPGPRLSSESGQMVQAFVSRAERSAEDRAVDVYRKPAQTLEFFGLEPNMKVIEFFPGGGYMSENIRNGLNDQGQLHLVGFAEPVAQRLTAAGYTHVSAMPESAMATGPSDEPGGKFTLEKFDLTVNDADMFLTFRNTHNITEASRHLFHEGVFKALRPGGIYGIVDHTKRHMDPGSPEIWRRVDPVQMIKEVEAAGFEFVDYSTLHYRPDDGLIFDSTRPSLNRYSDRFTLKFRKPS